MKTQLVIIGMVIATALFTGLKLYGYLVQHLQVLSNF